MVRKEKKSVKQQQQEKEKEKRKRGAALTTTLVCISVRACSSLSRTRPLGFSSVKSLLKSFCFFFFFSKSARAFCLGTFLTRKLF
jgi:hypothetical protein